MCLTVLPPCGITAASHLLPRLLSSAVPAAPQPCSLSAAGHWPSVARSAAHLQVKEELSRQAQLLRLKRDLQDASAALSAQASNAEAKLADLQ